MILEAVLALMIFSLAGHIIDYRILKNRHFNKHKWDLNICCGPTDGSGVNADIITRKVPNFILIKDIYNLPFRNKQFKNVVSSHTIEHVENPGRFYRELRRISENVVLLVPPVWDFAALGFLMEHRWQFLTLRTKHINKLPGRFKLPYWWYHSKVGQRIK